MLHAPFNPPGDVLHVVGRILPISLMHTKFRLNIVRQLIMLNPNNLEEHPKSKLTLMLRSEYTKCMKYFNGSKNVTGEPMIKQPIIKNYINHLWDMKWNNHLQRTQSCGLISTMDHPKLLLYKNQIPDTISPKLVGNLCALITGHSRLQDHTYLLKLTFSPTCICLTGDETPYHFLYDCPLYSNLRNADPPNTQNWSSVARYIEKSGRNP